MLGLGQLVSEGVSSLSVSPQTIRSGCCGTGAISGGVLGRCELVIPSVLVHQLDVSGGVLSDPDEVRSRGLTGAYDHPAQGLVSPPHRS